MRLICLGDVMLARGVSKVLADSDPGSLWGNCLPHLEEAELRLANLECCISDRGEPFDPPRVFNFRAIPKAIEVLLAARIDVVNLANNHSIDYQEEALADTLERLDRAGIAHVGAGRNLQEAAAPAILSAGDTKIGFVGFADHYSEYAAGEDRPGIFHVDTRGSPEIVIREVRRARDGGAGVVVVTAHCGPNMVTHPSAHLQRFARAVVSEGADFWFGHSAHVFQGVEFFDGKPIVHDGGDFLDDYAVDPVLRNDRSLLWRISWEDGRVSLEGTPVQLSFAVTHLAEGEAFEWISDHLAGLCAEMGSRVRLEDERLVISPS